MRLDADREAIAKRSGLWYGWDQERPIDGQDVICLCRCGGERLRLSGYVMQAASAEDDIEGRFERQVWLSHIMHHPGCIHRDMWLTEAASPHHHIAALVQLLYHIQREHTA